MKNVVVEVTNVDEPGKVTLSALQPQSAVPFTAVHTDPDGSISDRKWQWAKASSKNGRYADIDKATGDAYTPVDGDVNSYLRATASYTDKEGSGKSAMVVSEYAVQARRGSNKAPAFPDQDPETDGVQKRRDDEIGSGEHEGWSGHWKPGCGRGQGHRSRRGADLHTVRRH